MRVEGGMALRHRSEDRRISRPDRQNDGRRASRRIRQRRRCSAVRRRHPARDVVAQYSRVHRRRRIIFRVGVNVGDIIIDDYDIFGDGVNVAARLEGLAEPGGICVSQIVRDQVHGKLDVTFVDKGTSGQKYRAPGSRLPRLAVRKRAEKTAGHTHAHRGFGPDQQPIGVCKVSLSIASPRNIGLSSFIHGGSCSRPCERAFLVHWREVQIWGTGFEPNLAGERWSRQTQSGALRNRSVLASTHDDR